MIPLIIIAIQFISRHFFPIFHGTTSFPFFISSFLQIPMNMHGYHQLNEHFFLRVHEEWRNGECEERREMERRKRRQTDRPSVSSAIMPA